MCAPTTYRDNWRPWWESGHSVLPHRPSFFGGPGCAGTASPVLRNLPDLWAPRCSFRGTTIEYHTLLGVGRPTIMINVIKAWRPWWESGHSVLPHRPSFFGEPGCAGTASPVLRNTQPSNTTPRRGVEGRHFCIIQARRPWWESNPQPSD
jgi:hypothetical protein